MPDAIPSMQNGISKAGKRWLLVVFPIVILGFCLFEIRGCLPGGNRIIASAKASDGTEMCVIQTYNDITEPYTIGFYYRKPGKPWGWFYYDHQDTRWYSSKIFFSEDGKLAHILRGNQEVARFEIPSESFTIVRWSRTLSPAQEWMPEGWKPEDALKRQAPKSPMALGAPSNNPPSH